ncbi:MAG: glycosyltransferase family 2 protein [Candidatus Riflebacteria bacterium]|nr:glycosyltransferase family 2 protein [Candidatus Riflebacteria bacterium]
MTGAAPKLTVCLPAHNRASYLREALASILRQTVTDFEVVVCDDASEDDLEAVVASFGDRRLRYFRQPRNSGICASRNACLARARGKYISWLDSDDLWHPGLLEAESAVLDGKAEVGLVHTAFDVIGADGQRLGDWPRAFDRDLVQPPAETFRELALHNFVAMPTVMVRRSVQERAGVFAAGMGNDCEDWELWMRMSLVTHFAYLASPLAQVRHHPTRGSLDSIESGERFRHEVRAVRSVFARPELDLPDRAANWRRARAALAARAVLRTGSLFLAGRRWAAMGAAFAGARLAPAPHPWRLFTRLGIDLLRSDEPSLHVDSKALLALLTELLDGTRYGEQLRKKTAVDPEWSRTLERIARTVARVVPPGAPMAVADKGDPTLAHLSGREAFHFPDWRTVSGGYPADSEAAIEQLEHLRLRRAAFLVFPSASFWWLAHYAAFAEHLESKYTRVWQDADCIIFGLGPGPVDGPLGTLREEGSEP